MDLSGTKCSMASYSNSAPVPIILHTLLLLYCYAEHRAVHMKLPMRDRKGLFRFYCCNVLCTSMGRQRNSLAANLKIGVVEGICDVPSQLQELFSL